MIPDNINNSSNSSLPPGKCIIIFLIKFTDENNYSAVIDSDSEHHQLKLKEWKILVDKYNLANANNIDILNVSHFDVQQLAVSLIQRNAAFTTLICESPIEVIIDTTNRLQVLKGVKRLVNELMNFITVSCEMKTVEDESNEPSTSASQTGPFLQQVRRVATELIGCIKKEISETLCVPFPRD